MSKLQEDLNAPKVEPSFELREGDGVPAVEAVNLTKRFGKRVSVDRLNLKIYPGELYALLGDNGAGKSTTINMLTTLLKPTEGKFFIGGYDGVRQSEKIKGLFGIVSQDVAVYHELTAYENLQFIADLYQLPKARAKQRIDYLLEASGLSERANDLVGDFSGGMQRKLSIANALLHEPQVIFMDEPTVGLDPTARRQFWSALRDLRQEGITILLTTHYLEEAEVLADRIGIIRLGQLVAEGTIDELRHRIQAIRNIEVRLLKSYEPAQIEAKLDRLGGLFSVRPAFQASHNVLVFVPPKDVSLSQSLHAVLNWLEREGLDFSTFSTSEPNLEEIFLALSHGASNDELANSEKL